ncbi:hypothetical protein FIBSPDRAFT_524202 [Athelia psychrophila]|uniref:Uncharacterized protein n=1 Tax=Athelia psychrophila TaxID=1759441 RepID=A0A166JPN7_9AGAM|nr:hypothetical protein FIBSPDRAFT_524202 [Fibularhizoctonia sp. CBS 109695]
MYILCPRVVPGLLFLMNIGWTCVILISDTLIVCGWFIWTPVWPRTGRHGAASKRLIVFKTLISKWPSAEASSSTSSLHPLAI